MSFRPFLILTAACLPCHALAQVAVRFDATQTVPCLDVTTQEFAIDHPGEALWEAKLEISSRIDGEEKSLRSFLYRIDSLAEGLVFIDYLPHTTLHSEYAGNVNVENKDEKTNTLGVSATLETIVKLTPNANSSRKRSTNINYSLLPPQEQVAASGTQRRGRGVYFKLKPSSQHTLEGGKEFALVFRAPLGWRAGTVLLRCETTCLKRGLFRDAQDSAGTAMYMLTFYQSGDPDAKRTAQNYADAELWLRQQAHQNRAGIRKKQQSPNTPLNLLRSPPPPKIPRGWLEQLMVMPGNSNWPQYSEHLPVGVRRSGEAFLAAKSDLQRLSDVHGSQPSNAAANRTPARGLLFEN